MASVVIPAHNEQTTITRLLTGIYDADESTDFLEVIVVANGCTDQTARMASEVSPRVRVHEIPETSKIAALNAGDRVTTCETRIYLDADVVISGSDLVSLAKVLSASKQACAAAPTMRVDVSRSSRWVQHYHRIWEITDFRGQGHLGSGVYGVSAAGRKRWSVFPPVIADDRFVQLHFAPEEIQGLPESTFVVEAPRRVGPLVGRAIRIQAGNAEISRLYPELSRDDGGRTWVRRVARQPTLWPSFVIYASVYTVARLRARTLALRDAPVAWRRDESVR